MRVLVLSKSDKNKHTVVDGPFTETKELITGYWPWQVKSRTRGLDERLLRQSAPSVARKWGTARATARVT